MHRRGKVVSSYADSPSSCRRAASKWMQENRVHEIHIKMFLKEKKKIIPENISSIQRLLYNIKNQYK